jgi:hypothetical protein
MNIFGTKSMAQDPQPYSASVECKPPILAHESTNAATSATYTCASTDYGKLHEVTCTGGTFVVVSGASVSGKAGKLLASGASHFIRFDGTYNTLSYKELSGAAFSATVALTIVIVSS